MPSGGYRPGAGRPRKSPDATPAGVPVSKARKKPVAKPTAYPDVMGDYFAEAMKECADVVPTAAMLREELLAFITARGCDSLIAPQTITDYVISRQGFLACEAMCRRRGRMTSDEKLSPYVTAGQGYYKAMQADFNLIMQIINKYSGSQEQEQNAFLALLQNKGF